LNLLSVDRGTASDISLMASAVDSTQVFIISSSLACPIVTGFPCWSGGRFGPAVFDMVHLVNLQILEGGVQALINIHSHPVSPQL
jgi:hypothetical protein